MSVVAPGRVAPAIEIVIKRLFPKMPREPQRGEIVGLPANLPPPAYPFKLVYARKDGERWQEVPKAEGDRFYGAFRIR